MALPSTSDVEAAPAQRREVSVAANKVTDIAMAPSLAGIANLTARLHDPTKTLSSTVPTSLLETAVSHLPKDQIQEGETKASSVGGCNGLPH